MALISKLTAIGDAIRAKTGSTATMTLDQMATAIAGISTGVDTSSDTVTAAALLSGITAHDASGSLVTGNVVIQKYYTGSTEPTSSLGNDGDLYLMT